MDNKELERIYEDSYRAVYWTALSLMKNEDSAEDIVQETYVTLIDSYETLNDKSKVVAWLKKIAANKCLNTLTRTRTVNVEDEFLDNAETVPEIYLPDSIIESDEKRRIIMDIIENTLSEDIRRTIILYYFDEMTTKEIAEALNVPQGTVLWRLSFAKKKIRKEVEKYEEENDDKLFAAVPFLTLLFRKEAEQVALKPIPASLLKTSASPKAPGQGAASKTATAAKTVAKKGEGLMFQKIIIGIVTLALLGGSVALVVSKVKQKEETRVALETNAEAVSEGIGVKVESGRATLTANDQKNYQLGEAFYKAVVAIRDDLTLPDGQKLVPYCDDFAENGWTTYSIYDYDNDGRYELGVHWQISGPSNVSSAHFYMFDYDLDNDTWTLEFDTILGPVFFNNGTIQTSHSEEQITEYDYYRYNPETDKYDLMGYVELLGKSEFPEGEFPEDAANGQTYVFAIHIPGYEDRYYSWDDLKLATNEFLGVIADENHCKGLICQPFTDNNVEGIKQHFIDDN